MVRKQTTVVMALLALMAGTVLSPIGAVAGLLGGANTERTVCAAQPAAAATTATYRTQPRSERAPAQLAYWHHRHHHHHHGHGGIHIVL